MTPSARIHAAIELLESIYASWNGETRVAADKLCDLYFKARRYIGSHDRGAVAELTYWCLRHKAELDWHCERHHLMPSARTHIICALLIRADAPPAQLAALFDGGKYAPAPLTESEWHAAHALFKTIFSKAGDDTLPAHVRLNYPAWMESVLRESLGAKLEAEMEAMQAQAPLDLRANTLLITRDALLAQMKEAGFSVTPTPVSPTGIRLQKREPVFGSPLFRQGFFEVQDDGSQAIAHLVDAHPGMRVIDFCAGAGGKTLAVAAQMENKGRLLAFDTSAKRLAQLPLRLKRAQVFNTEWRALSSERDAYVKRHKQSADRVLLDVPCSGSGTWRRNPDLKWRFTRQDLQEVLDLQSRILESASRLAKIGGRVIYSTCSLLKCENEQQVANFIAAHPNFRVVCAQKVWNKDTAVDSSSPSYLWLTPQQDGCDGFFAAVLERIAA